MCINYPRVVEWASFPFIYAFLSYMSMVVIHFHIIVISYEGHGSLKSSANQDFIRVNNKGSIKPPQFGLLLGDLTGGI